LPGAGPKGGPAGQVGTTGALCLPRQTREPARLLAPRNAGISPALGLRARCPCSQESDEGHDHGSGRAGPVFHRPHVAQCAASIRRAPSARRSSQGGHCPPKKTLAHLVGCGRSVDQGRDEPSPRSTLQHRMSQLVLGMDAIFGQTPGHVALRFPRRQNLQIDQGMLRHSVELSYPVTQRVGEVSSP